MMILTRLSYKHKPQLPVIAAQFCFSLHLIFKHISAFPKHMRGLGWRQIKKGNFNSPQIYWGWTCSLGPPSGCRGPMHLHSPHIARNSSAFIQELGDEGFWSFQWSKIRLQAAREAKAIILLFLWVAHSTGTPQIEIKGLGTTGLLGALKVWLTYYITYTYIYILTHFFLFFPYHFHGKK